VENGNYKGWGYVDTTTDQSYEGLRDAISYKDFHKDSNWIIHQYLLKNGSHGIVKFNPHESLTFDE
jgi:hypothetical protein